MLEKCPPRMPAGYRLLPILERLRNEQKFEILFCVISDMPAAQHFLKAMIAEEEDQVLWDFFARIWPQISKEARNYSLLQVHRF